MPLFARHLHLPPSEVDALTVDQWDVLTAYIDGFEAQLRAEAGDG